MGWNDHVEMDDDITDEEREQNDALWEDEYDAWRDRESEILDAQFDDLVKRKVDDQQSYFKNNEERVLKHLLAHIEFKLSVIHKR